MDFPVRYGIDLEHRSYVLDKKKAARLYDHGEIKKIKAKYPNRYETWECVHDDLKSKTKLKREYKFDVRKAGLKPVGDVRSRVGWLRFFVQQKT